ncbi:hypothetical protein PInf_014896 [Phytophthora infestans]|nr:hypothetical protein PInf_014896 [Phytophthora infestans]
MEKPFKQIWRELTKKGWIPRRPKGLSVDFTYVPPEGDAKGVEGVDYFVGSTVPESNAPVPDNTVHTIPDMTGALQDNASRAVSDGSVDTAQCSNDHCERPAPAITLDDFDSDDFLAALRRDRLFDKTDDEELYLEEGIWLLSLDSDTEGDEDSILLDKDMCDVDDEASTGSYEDDELDDDVNFGLGKEVLDDLQRAGWDTYDKHTNDQLRLDASPMYEGPFGPTKAALAYADSPLAMFFFFLPKELRRKIAEETNKFRDECVEEVALSMRERARLRREKAPSTVVLSVEEYRTKLQRKTAVQPHEFMRRLHVDLLSQTREDFLPENNGEELLAAPVPRQPHALQQAREKNGQKRPGVRSYESSYFCRTCSLSKKGRVTLCNMARRLEQGSELTCSQVWHQTWRNGTAVPSELQHKIRFVAKRRVDDGNTDEDFL